jgi:hypothetical protein
VLVLTKEYAQCAFASYDAKAWSTRQTPGGRVIAESALRLIRHTRLMNLLILRSQRGLLRRPKGFGRIKPHILTAHTSGGMVLHWPFQLGYFASSAACALIIGTISALASANVQIEL